MAIPITVLEELDRFKVGNETKHFEARECIRILDRLSQQHSLQQWIPVENGLGGELKIIMDSECRQGTASEVFSEQTNDHKILDAALCLQAAEPKSKVVLVSKDINLRLKAKALNLPAEDYQTGKVKDNRHMYTGRTSLEGVDSDVIRRMYLDGVTRKITALGPDRQNNHFYILKDGSASAMGFYNETKRVVDRVMKCILTASSRNMQSGIRAARHSKPRHQFGHHLWCRWHRKDVAGIGWSPGTAQAIRPDHSGQANRGVEQQGFGFFAGDAEEKVNPYMQPLFDNLNFIKSQFGPNERKNRAIEDMRRDGKIQISPLAYIRPVTVQCHLHCGRGPKPHLHEVKTIITRAGENTKIILTGDIRQIDTPYLDEQSNGLTYVIDRLRGKDLYCHVTLEKGERSELANFGQ